jgi:hypothetical protein
MTTQPTTTAAPAEPDNITPIHVPVDGASPTPPTAEQVEAARKAVEDDMREAVPFNRLAIQTGFQRAIQAAVVSSKPEKAGSLCSAYRSYAEAESLLRSSHG